METNPYEAPVAHVEDAAPAIDVETERRAHLRREAGLRGIGLLCLVFAAFLLLMGGVVLGTGLEDGTGQDMAWGMGTAFLGLGATGLAATWGYLRLRPWVHFPAAIVCLAVLVMTVMFGLPLVALAAWITWSAKGRRVLSDDYAAIRAATPTLRAWRQPHEALVLLGLLSAYVALAVVMYQQFAGRD